MAAGDTYKIIELVGSSSEGVDSAIRGAIERASQTLRHLDWFEVKEIRGQISDQQIAWFQVKLDVGFRVDDTSDVSA